MQGEDGATSQQGRRQGYGAGTESGGEAPFPAAHGSQAARKHAGPASLTSNEPGRGPAFTSRPRPRWHLLPLNGSEARSAVPASHRPVRLADMMAVPREAVGSQVVQAHRPGAGGPAPGPTCPCVTPLGSQSTGQASCEALAQRAAVIGGESAAHGPGH